MLKATGSIRAGIPKFYTFLDNYMAKTSDQICHAIVYCDLLRYAQQNVHNQTKNLASTNVCY